MRCLLILFILVQTRLIAQKQVYNDYVVLSSGDTLYGKVKYVDEDRITPKFYKKIRITLTTRLIILF